MRISLHSFAFTLGVSTALFTPSICRAEEGLPQYPSCDAGPSESDVSAAKGAYEAGQVSFQEADYDRALLYWEDAFRRDCTAVKLLLNIARAYELSGNRQAAVYALQTYLDRRPEASDRASVEKRVKKLQEKISEQPANDATPTPADEPRENPEQAPSDATSEPASPPSDFGPENNRPLWPVILTGSGVVVNLIGLGAVLAGQATIETEKDSIDSQLPACERSGRNWECATDADIAEVRRALDNNAKIQEGEQTRNVGWIVAGVGLATAGVGAYFWITEWKKPAAQTSKTQFTPVVAPGYQGFSFQTSF